MDAARPLAMTLRNSAGGAIRPSGILRRWTPPLRPWAAPWAKRWTPLPAPSTVSEAQVQRVLAGESVYFDYGLTLPAAVLASWLDAVPEESLPEVHACALAVEGDQVALYLLGETYQRAETGLLPETLENLLEQFRPDGSAFAFEVDSTLAPDALLPGGNPAPPSAVVGNPCDNRYIESLATALGFNPMATPPILTATARPISRGRLRPANLRRGRDSFDLHGPGPLPGRRRRRGGTGGGGPPPGGPGRGRRRRGGAAVPSDLTVTEEETVCTFDYYLSGIPVSLAAGYGDTSDVFRPVGPADGGDRPPL